MAQQNPRRRVSWELVGIVLVAAVFVVMFLIWLVSPESRGELRAPAQLTLDPALGLSSGTTKDGQPYLGSPDAPVTLYMFADFQCPHCKAYTDDSRPIDQDYVKTGKVRVVWVNFPTYGAESYAAANAGACALEQGRFWEMHDWLYANQSKVPESGGFSTARLRQIAEKAGVDLAAFDTCVAKPATAERVKQDENFATESGVAKTPTFMVGDRTVVGSDIRALRALLDGASKP